MKNITGTLVLAIGAFEIFAPPVNLFWEILGVIFIGFGIKILIEQP